VDKGNVRHAVTEEDAAAMATLQPLLLEGPASFASIPTEPPPLPPASPLTRWRLLMLMEHPAQGVASETPVWFSRPRTLTR